MLSRLLEQDTLKCKCCCCMPARGAANSLQSVSIVDVLEEGFHHMTNILKLLPATSLWSICARAGYNFRGFSRNFVLQHCSVSPKNTQIQTFHNGRKFCKSSFASSSFSFNQLETLHLEQAAS